MSYSDKQDDIFSDRLKRLNRDLEICRKVEHTLSTDGWKNTIGPLLDKMIIDILGGKINGEWIAGKVDKARKDERREFYIGAKQALVEFHQRISSHVRQIKILEEQIKQLQLDEKRGYKRPLEDTRYNPE